MTAPTAALQPAGKAAIGPTRKRGCSEGIEEAPEMDRSPRGTGKIGVTGGLTPPPAGRLRCQSQTGSKENGEEGGGVKLQRRAQLEGEITSWTAGASESPPEGAEPTQTVG